MWVSSSVLQVLNWTRPDKGIVSQGFYYKVTSVVTWVRPEKVDTKVFQVHYISPRNYSWTNQKVADKLLILSATVKSPVIFPSNAKKVADK